MSFTQLFLHIQAKWIFCVCRVFVSDHEHFEFANAFYKIPFTFSQIPLR